MYAFSPELSVWLKGVAIRMGSYTLMLRWIIHLLKANEKFGITLQVNRELIKTVFREILLVPPI